MLINIIRFVLKTSLCIQLWAGKDDQKDYFNNTEYYTTVLE